MIIIPFTPYNLVSDKKYSTTHALISLTEDIRKNLDEGNIGRRIFVDLQKAFVTVEYDILLAKLEHYGVCGLTTSLASVSYGVQ